MKSLLLSLCLFFSPFFADAYPVKILKVKGTKAIIKLPKEAQVEKGEVYYLNMEKESEVADEGESSSYGRGQFLGGEVDFRSLTANSGASGSTYQIISVDAYLGFNMARYEIAPLVSFQQFTVGTAKSQSWLAGFLADYNFNENYNGVESVWSFRLHVAYGNEEQGTSPVNIIRAQASGVYKWFFPETNVSIGAQLGYRYESLSDDSTRTGFIFLAQIQNYFELF